MKTKYTMKEVCAWSVTAAALEKGIVEHRYVEISCEDHPPSHPQVIELPTSEAIHLCASMASPSAVQGFLSNVPVGGPIPSFGGLALPMIAQLLSQKNATVPGGLNMTVLSDGSISLYSRPDHETDYFVSHFLRKAKDEL